MEKSSPYIHHFKLNTMIIKHPPSQLSPFVLLVCCMFFFLACPRPPVVNDNYETIYRATPQNILDRLTEGKYPVEFDRLGGAVRPDELIVLFPPNTPKPQRDSIVKAKSMEVIRRCPCDEDLYLLGGNLTGGPAGQLDNTGGSKDGGGLSGQGGNNYTHFRENGKSNFEIPNIKTADNIEPAKEEDIIVAVIDTGVDWDQPDCPSPGGGMFSHIWRNNDETLSGADDDSNGLIDDIIGWDFVANDNNPHDENSHGTHVAGIVLHTLNNLGFDGNVKIMPYRVLDENGFGTLFDAACATICAVKNGAKVINLSLGWYGEENIIFAKVLEKMEQQYPGV
ncbi:MAG TPA: hypothetical protein ENJ20_05750, partial [Bacteroidetes bacterium]|nr:hypothetical protein [Bacteroidota bacterium]